MADQSKVSTIIRSYSLPLPHQNLELAQELTNDILALVGIDPASQRELVLDQKLENIVERLNTKLNDANRALGPDDHLFEFKGIEWNSGIWKSMRLARSILIRTYRLCYNDQEAGEWIRKLSTNWADLCSDLQKAHVALERKRVR